MEHVSKSKISRIRSLRLKKHRDALRLFTAEGEKCVLDTLSTFRREALVATADWWSHHPGLADDTSLVATAEEMQKMSSLSTAPEVMAIYAMPDAPQGVPRFGEDELVIMLDGVQDPGNLGTIIRIADWFGVETIVASRDTADIYNAKTVQATMGALGRVRVLYCDLPEVVRANPGMPLYGTLLDGTDIYRTPLSRGGFVAFGNEGKGLSEELRRLVARPLLIPCYARGDQHSESLNVAVATAVTVAEFRRRDG